MATHRLFPEARHDRLRWAGRAGRFHAQRPGRAAALDHRGYLQAIPSAGSDHAGTPRSPNSDRHWLLRGRGSRCDPRRSRFLFSFFLMVIPISLTYLAYGGLLWMQALFYTIGATVIAIIAIAAYKLARSTNKRNPLIWGIFFFFTA